MRLELSLPTLCLVALVAGCGHSSGVYPNSTNGNEPLCTYAGLENIPASSPQCVAPAPPPPPPPPVAMCPLPGLGSITASDPACVAPMGNPLPPPPPRIDSVATDKSARAEAERLRAARLEAIARARRAKGTQSFERAEKDTIASPPTYSPLLSGLQSGSSFSKSLTPATMQVTGVGNMRRKVSSPVRIVLQHIHGDTRTALAEADTTAAKAPGGGVAALTKIGDEATVCLKGDTANFHITGGEVRAPLDDGMCSTRSVSEEDPAPWVFHVTPQHGGEHSLEVEVRAGLSRRVVFDSTYSIQVHVGSLWDELLDGISSVTLLTKMLTALLVAVAALAVAWKALRKA
jgi:hypothetical protein